MFWSTAKGFAEVKNYNLVNRSAKKLSKAIEGKSQLDTKMTLVTSPYIALQGIVTKLTGGVKFLFQKTK